MIWPGVTYPTDTRLYEIPQDIAPLVMSLGCLFSRMRPPLPIKRRQLLRCLHLKNASSYFAGFDGSW